MFNQDGLMEIVDPEFAGYPWVPGCEADKSNLTEYDVLEKQAYVFSHGHGPTLEKSQERGWEKDNQAPESVARHLGLPVRKIKPFLTGESLTLLFLRLFFFFLNLYSFFFSLNYYYNRWEHHV